MALPFAKLVSVTPIWDVALVAFRKISCWKAPCGATEGEMPLKVIFPAATIVMAACAPRAGSIVETAKIVAVAYVGTVAGAV